MGRIAGVTRRLNRVSEYRLLLVEEDLHSQANEEEVRVATQDISSG